MKEQLQPDMHDIKSALERLITQMSVGSLRDKGKDCVMDDTSRRDLRDIADTIRKDVFTPRKVDTITGLAGTISTVIAIIAVMTAIIKPMNDDRNSIKDLLKEHIAEGITREKEHDSKLDRDMVRLEDRIKEAVKEANNRMDTMAELQDSNHYQLLADLEKIKEGEIIDKAINAKVEMVFEMLNKKGQL